MASINVTNEFDDVTIEVELQGTGPVGPQGPQGEQGMQGETGPQGEQGETGNGIKSAVLNDDYTLTITFTDGTSYTSPSIRGETGATGAKGDKGDKGNTGATGNGIQSAVLNSDYTLTIKFTDGTSYTTPSIRGAKGEKGDTYTITEADYSAIGDVVANEHGEELIAGAISQYATDLNTEIEARKAADSELNEDIVHLEDTKASKHSLAYTEERLENVIHMLNGVAYTEVTDSSEAYQKDVAYDSSLDVLHTDGIEEWAALESFGGKSVVWNQNTNLTGLSNKTVANVVFTKTEDGYGFTLNGTASAATRFNFTDPSSWLTVGHVFYFCTNGDAEFDYLAGGMCISNSGANLISINDRLALIQMEYNQYGFRTQTNSVYDNLTIRPKAFDLTKMFGVTSTAAVTDAMKSFCESYSAAHPEYNAGEIVNANVNEIVSADSTGTAVDTHTIPAEVTGLEGYGWSNNYVDLVNRKFVRAVESQTIDDDGNLSQTLYDTPVETDISSYLDEDFELLAVEGGGTVTFNQSDDTELPVPSTIVYDLDIEEAAT